MKVSSLRYRTATADHPSLFSFRFRVVLFLYSLSICLRSYLVIPTFALRSPTIVISLLGISLMV